MSLSFLLMGRSCSSKGVCYLCALGCDSEGGITGMRYLILAGSTPSSGGCQNGHAC